MLHSLCVLPAKTKHRMLRSSRQDRGLTESEKADESSTPSYLLLLHSGGGCNGGVSHLRRDSGRTESEKADESSTYSDAIVSCSYVYAQRARMLDMYVYMYACMYVCVCVCVCVHACVYEEMCIHTSQCTTDTHAHIIHLRALVPKSLLLPAPIT